MYLNLGSDYIVNVKEITGIFDLDNTTVSGKTKNLFKNAEEKGMIISVDNEIPKSFIMADKYGESKIYLSSLSSVTLKKRVESLYE